MSTHTPGPWAYRCVGYGSHIEPSIGWVGYGSAHPKDEYIANARLIAAAPELLKLCEAFRIAAIFEGLQETMAWRCLIDEAAEIIAKAKGEAQ